MTLTARETYAMLGEEPLWHAAAACHEVLAEAEAPHAVIGGVAVCLHGYRRNTVDVDLLVRPEDMPRIREALTAAGFTWDEPGREFHSPAGIPIQFLAAGGQAGKGSEVLLPSPADEQVAIIVELIAVHKLDGSFARHLHKVVRPTFRRLVRHVG